MRDDGGERGEAAPRAANKRQLPFASEGGGGGLGKANATFAFKNRHNLDVVPYYMESLKHIIL